MANVSHELRTPLHGILGLVDLALQAPDLGPEQQEYLNAIRESGKLLLVVINDVLDHSKIAAGKLELESIPFCLQPMLFHVLSLMSEIAKAKGVTLTCDLDPGVPAAVEGDPQRLKQIWMNLLSNAIRFTPAGGKVNLSGHLKELKDGVATLQFQVQDTGIGMTQETMGRLFKPFTQADSSTTRRFGGTGLGLAISKQLVAMMHGEIGAESAVGKGSTFSFTVTLPVCSPEAAVLASSPSPHALTPSAGRRAPVSFGGSAPVDLAASSPLGQRSVGALGAAAAGGGELQRPVASPTGSAAARGSPTHGGISCLSPPSVAMAAAAKSGVYNPGTLPSKVGAAGAGRPGETPEPWAAGGARDTALELPGLRALAAAKAGSFAVTSTPSHRALAAAAALGTPRGRASAGVGAAGAGQPVAGAGPPVALPRASAGPPSLAAVAALAALREPCAVREIVAASSGSSKIPPAAAPVAAAVAGAGREGGAALAGSLSAGQGALTRLPEAAAVGRQDEPAAASELSVASTIAVPQHVEMARAFKGLGIAVPGPFGEPVAVPADGPTSLRSPPRDGPGLGTTSRPHLEASHHNGRSTVPLDSGPSPPAIMTGFSAAAASAGPPGADAARHAFPPDAALGRVPSSGSLERYTPASDGAERVMPTPSGMPPRILLAEDNAVNSMIAKRFLRNLGYLHVTLAENGQEAVEALQADTPSLVLMDCQMPVMDGYEATRRIRALPDPDKRTVPIIALTASALKADVDRCMAAGMDDHLSKPYDSKALGAKLARWLRAGVPHRRASSAPVLPTEEELVTRTPSVKIADGRASAGSSSVLLGVTER